MTRSEANILNDQIRLMLDQSEHSVNWIMDSGEVVMKRNGQVKLSYSVRSDMDEAKEVKRLIGEFLKGKFDVVRLTLTNMLNTYRSEVKVTVVIG